MRIQPAHNVKRSASAPVTRSARPKTELSEVISASKPSEVIPESKPKKISIKLNLKPKALEMPKPIIGNARVTKKGPKRGITFTGLDAVLDYGIKLPPSNSRLDHSVAEALETIRKAGLSLKDCPRIAEAEEALNTERAKSRAAQAELGTIQQRLEEARNSLAKTVPLHRFEALQNKLAQRPLHRDHEALLEKNAQLVKDKASMQEALNAHKEELNAHKEELNAHQEKLATLQSERDALDDRVTTLLVQQLGSPFAPAAELPPLSLDHDSFFDDAMGSPLFGTPYPDAE